MLNPEWPLENGLPQGLPWNNAVGLLLDGVSVEKLPQHLYQWTENPEFEPIRVDLKEEPLLIEGIVVGVVRRGRASGLM